jgi:hypothetical protein
VIFVIALLVCFCLFFLWQRRGGSGGEGSGRNKKGNGSGIEFSEFADDYVDPMQLKAQEELEKGGGGRGRLVSVDGEVACCCLIIGWLLACLLACLLTSLLAFLSIMSRLERVTRVLCSYSNAATK